MDDQSNNQSLDNLPNPPASNPSPNFVREAPATFSMESAPGWASAMGSAVEKLHKAKVFKSGNSMALRLPKALGLEAGTEMEISMQADGTYLLKRADAPKRKINVDAFWGKAPWLKELTPEEREFEHRELDWHLLGDPDEPR